MGFLEWLGVKSYKPDYSEAMKVYERMMDMSNIDKMRESRLADWEQMQKRAFGDIERGVAQRWGGTGATTLGVESGVPGAWTGEASSRWMQDVGNPMARSIEQEWLGATQQQTMAAEMARQQLEEQARAEAQARTGAGMGFLGNIFGTAASFIPGVGNLFGGGGQQQMSAGYNPYLDPRYWQNFSNPIYYPGQAPAGGSGQWGG